MGQALESGIQRAHFVIHRMGALRCPIIITEWGGGCLFSMISPKKCISRTDCMFQVVLLAAVIYLAQFLTLPELVSAQPLGNGVWNVPERSRTRVPAFLIGNWESLASGDLSFGAFESLSPPDMAVGLGLATVYGPEQAGWFFHAGRRIHLQAPDGVVYSYESLAELGWGAGIARAYSKKYCLRGSFDAGGEAVALEDFISHCMREAQAPGPWMLAAHVEFLPVQGRQLRRSPVRPKAGGGGDTGAFAEVAAEALGNQTESQRRGGGILVVLAAGRDDPDPADKTIGDRFLGGELRTRRANSYRAHYGIFKSPAPMFDASKPFTAIWQVASRDAMPQFAAVGEALPGTRIGRANVLVWSIQSIEPYNLYPEPDFVDMTMLDPTIQTDQRFATKSNPFGVALYSRPRFLIRRPVAEAVLRAHENLKAQGYLLKLHDAYRPLSVTQRLWHMYLDMEVSKDTERRYLAVPNVGSRHNRGAAVDCSLTDLNGAPVEMPSDYLVFDERANLDSKSMTANARKNLAILSKAMTAQGFTTIRDEWWHFDAPGWMNYRVANVPFWPEDSEPDRVAERTRKLMEKMGRVHVAQALPDMLLPDGPVSPTPEPDIFSLPELKETPAIAGMELPRLNDARSEALAGVENADKNSEDRSDGTKGDRSGSDGGFAAFWQGIQGLPLLVGSIVCMIALIALVAPMVIRPGRRSGATRP